MRLPVSAGFFTPRSEVVNDTKHTEQVKLTLTERELLDASRIAAAQDRSLADFIRLTLRVSMYGTIRHMDSDCEGTNQDRKS